MMLLDYADFLTAAGQGLPTVGHFYIFAEG